MIKNYAMIANHIEKMIYLIEKAHFHPLNDLSLNQISSLLDF